MTTQSIDVTPAQLAGLISMTMATKRPLMVWGDGGIGKSRIIEQAAAQAGRAYVDFRALIKDLPDLQGYPVISNMVAGESCPMTAPAGLPASNDQRPMVLVLEELPSAARAMQAGLYGLVLERRINEYTLPHDCVVIATGNELSSGGVVNPMPLPLANRFTHVRLIVDPAQSLAYAIRQQWSGFVTSYLSMPSNKSAWLSLDTKEKESKTYASPRSWEFASEILKSGALPADCIRPAMCGTLGNREGDRFAAFVSLYSTLAPTLDSVESDPQNCPLPPDAASQWFIAGYLVESASPATVPWVIPALLRLPDELAVFAMQSITQRDPLISHCPQFIQFAANPRYQAIAALI